MGLVIVTGANGGMGLAFAIIMGKEIYSVR